MSCNCPACLHHAVCPAYFDMQQQYYVAHFAVKACLEPHWHRSFDQLFQWCSTATPMARTQWIRQRIDGFDEHPVVQAFHDSMQALLKFHHLKMVYNNEMDDVLVVLE